MPKILYQILTFLLVPNLLVNPALATTITASSLPNKYRADQSFMFVTNALAPTGIAQQVVPGTEQSGLFRSRREAGNLKKSVDSGYLQNMLSTTNRLGAVDTFIEKLRAGGDLSWIGHQSAGAAERLAMKPITVNMDNRASHLPATNALLSQFSLATARGYIDNADLLRLLVLYLRAMPEQVQMVDSNAAYNNLRMFADAILRLPVITDGQFILTNLSLFDNARGTEMYQLRFGERSDEQVRLEVNDNDLVIITDAWRVRFPAQFYDRYYPLLKTILKEIGLHRIQRSIRVEPVRQETARVRIVPRTNQPNFNAQSLEELRQLQQLVSRAVYGVHATRGVEITSDVVEQILRVARSTSNEVMFVLGVPQEKSPYDEKRGLITYTAFKESVEGGAVRVSMAQSRTGHIGHSHPFGNPGHALPLTANEDAVYISQFNNSPTRTFASIIVGGSGSRWGIGAWRFPENRTGITTNLDDLYSLPITVIDRNGRQLNEAQLRQIGIVQIVNSHPYLSPGEGPENMEDVIAMRRWLGELDSLIKSMEDDLNPRQRAFSIRIITEPLETLLPKGEALWRASRFSADIAPPRVGSTEGHVNEAILKAHHGFVDGSMDAVTAANTVLKALRTMEDPEYISNIGTAFAILRVANTPLSLQIAEVLRAYKDMHDHSGLMAALQPIFRHAVIDSGQGRSSASAPTVPDHVYINLHTRYFGVVTTLPDPSADIPENYSIEAKQPTNDELQLVFNNNGYISVRPPSTKHNSWMHTLGRQSEQKPQLDYHFDNRKPELVEIRFRGRSFTFKQFKTEAPMLLADQLMLLNATAFQGPYLYRAVRKDEWQDIQEKGYLLIRPEDNFETEVGQQVRHYAKDPEYAGVIIRIPVIGPYFRHAGMGIPRMTAIIPHFVKPEVLVSDQGKDEQWSDDFASAKSHAELNENSDTSSRLTIAPLAITRDWVTGLLTKNGLRGAARAARVVFGWIAAAVEIIPSLIPSLFPWMHREEDREFAKFWQPALILATVTGGIVGLLAAASLPVHDQARIATATAALANLFLHGIINTHKELSEEYLFATAA